MNVYQITGNNNYKKLAVKQVAFISKNFITKKGEWYAKIEYLGRKFTDRKGVVSIH